MKTSLFFVVLGLFVAKLYSLTTEHTEYTECNLPHFAADCGLYFFLYKTVWPRDARPNISVCFVYSVVENDYVWNTVFVRSIIA